MGENNCSLASRLYMAVNVLRITTLPLAVGKESAGVVGICGYICVLGIHIYPYVLILTCCFTVLSPRKFHNTLFADKDKNAAKWKKKVEFLGFTGSPGTIHAYRYFH